MRKLACTFVFIVFAITTKGQSFEIGVSGGASLYAGDLAPSKIETYLETTHPSFGLFGRINKGAFSGKLGFKYATVSGDDALRENPGRDLSFESDIFELALTAEWHIFRWQPGAGSLTIAPYLTAGAAVFQFNPKTFYEDRWVELQPLGTEGQGLEGFNNPYELTQFAVPMGGGLKFVFQNRWVIGLEAAGRKLFTDYLDDVSDTEITYQQILLGNGSLAAQLSKPDFDLDSDDPRQSFQRGKPAKDWYYIFDVSVSYLFGGGDYSNSNRIGKKSGRVICPEF